MICERCQKHAPLHLEAWYEPLPCKIHLRGSRSGTVLPAPGSGCQHQLVVLRTTESMSGVRGLSPGEAGKDSTKCHCSVSRLRLEEFQPTRDISWASARRFVKNKPSPFLSQEPHFSLLESVQGNNQFFIQFCTNVTLVNSQLVPFDPGLTHTRRLHYNHPTCQALIKVFFPVGLMDPYLFCCSPAVS